MPWSSRLSVPVSASASSRPTNGTLWIMIFSYRSRHGIARKHGLAHLVQDVPRVQPLVHHVDRQTDPLFPVPQRPVEWVFAAISRQQRGMEIGSQQPRYSEESPLSAGLCSPPPGKRPAQRRCIAATKSVVFGLTGSKTGMPRSLAVVMKFVAASVVLVLVRRGGRHVHHADDFTRQRQQRLEVTVAERSLAVAEEHHPHVRKWTALNAAARSWSGTSIAIRSMLEPSCTP